MSVVLCGYHNMGCAALKVLMNHSIDVPAVFTHRDDPDEHTWFRSLAAVAKKYDIPVYYPDNINDKKWVGLLKGLEPEVLLSCYFRQMIKEEILGIPRIAAVNLHGSLLPEYRGRCPVNWQLVHGEKKSGVTLHHMVLQADAGDIVGRKAVDVADTDTAVDLFAKLEGAAVQVLSEYIPRLLDGTAPRLKQDHSRATYFGGRKPADGRIDWAWNARCICNLVRAVAWPYPGAFFEKAGRKIMVWAAEPAERNGAPGTAPGTVISMDGGIPLIAAGEGAVRLKKLSEPGKSPEHPLSAAAIMSKGDVLQT